MKLDTMRYECTRISYRRIKKAGLVLGLAAMLLPLTDDARAAGKIYYGSRAGMQVTVASVSGIGTAHAVIHVKHTPDDAREFCEQYENDKSVACVDRVLRDTRINDVLTGNCVTGAFTSLYGESLRFVGEARRRGDGDPKYVILRGQEKLDGSGASGYGYDLEQFAALCPNRATPEE